MQITLPKEVNLILNTLNSNGYDAYVVGGCVRDSVMNIEPQDWDITTEALPEEIIYIFSQYKLLTTGVKHGTVGVIIDRKVYEITTYRIDGEYKDNRHPDKVTFSDKLEYDLERRDFTINAMAYNPKTGIIDLFDGKTDLKYKAIRCVGDADCRFKEDALRILRGLRFASTYDFTIEINTSDAMIENRKLLNNISEERIITEFNKLLCGVSARYILNRYKKIFAVFIPEIEVMFNFDQKNPHHNKTLWKHTTKSIDKIEPNLALRLTMLFHDIGKPLAQEYDEVKGICHYIGHNTFSVAIAENIMKRLKYSNELIETVKTLILYHDVRFSDNKKHIKRLLSKIGEDNFKLLLKVQRADILAQSNYQIEEKLNNLNFTETALNQIISENECFKLKDLAVNGHDLMRIGIIKGQDIGSTLNFLLSNVIDGNIKNEKEILLLKAKELNNI